VLQTKPNLSWDHTDFYVLCLILFYPILPNPKRPYHQSINAVFTQSQWSPESKYRLRINWVVRWQGGEQILGQNMDVWKYPLQYATPCWTLAVHAPKSPVCRQTAATAAFYPFCITFPAHALRLNPQIIYEICRGKHGNSLRLQVKLPQPARQKAEPL